MLEVDAGSGDSPSLSSDAGAVLKHKNHPPLVRKSLVPGADAKECDGYEEALLNELARREFTVFVLSEAGKPIFASCGSEEQLCSLAALIQTFVMVVGSWADSLIRFRSLKTHICFSYRSPLILAIVSRTPFNLESQLDILYKQVLSTLCRKQLVGVFQKKGPNFDLRLFLKDSDRHFNEIVYAYRADPCLFLRSVRVFPLASSERDFITNAIISAVNSEKADHLIMGLVVAHRQLVTVVRLKGLALHPFDLHILLNLVECNPSFRHAENWVPICLPHFDESGFVHAFLAYIWPGSAACLILLSVERSAFDVLRDVYQSITARLMSRPSLQPAFDNPPTFELNLANFPDVWHFIYKNRTSSQLCSSEFRIPYVNEEERRRLLNHYKQTVSFCMQSPSVKHLFVYRSDNSLVLTTTANYELHCVMSPFVSMSSAVSQIDRLLRALRKEESRFFITSSSFF
ncbi:unnamed protein product [Enterobius vermicularis]|uniref:Vacuolar fusion protein MON1 homolog n=1 Tax=Enterobius vermicularis TaxID=51028 RepID=A0A0N4VFL2_ENTVE|nr:unnamed protein product [Enterobius vermicularis]